MDKQQLGLLLDLLLQFEKEDFGDMENYGYGLWSRRNLDAMAEDVKTAMRNKE